MAQTSTPKLSSVGKPCSIRLQPKVWLAPLLAAGDHFRGGGGSQQSDRCTQTQTFVASMRASGLDCSKQYLLNRSSGGSGVDIAERRADAAEIMSVPVCLLKNIGANISVVLYCGLDTVDAVIKPGGKTPP